MNLTWTNLTWTERMDANWTSSQAWPAGPAGPRRSQAYSFLYFKELDMMMMMMMMVMVMVMVMVMTMAATMAAICCDHL